MLFIYSVYYSPMLECSADFICSVVCVFRWTMFRLSLRAHFYCLFVFLLHITCVFHLFLCFLIHFQENLFRVSKSLCRLYFLSMFLSMHVLSPFINFVLKDLFIFILCINVFCLCVHMPTEVRRGRQIP